MSDYQEDCLFCKIVAGEIPSTVVYQDENIYAFNDIYPQAPYHVLVIPKKHLAASMNDLTPEDGPILAHIFTAGHKIAEQLGIDKTGYRFVTNSGPDSLQSVFHLHFHLLGGAKMGFFGTPPTPKQ